MKNPFKNFKFSSFIANFSFAISYPIIKTIVTDGNKMVIFSDTILIMALVFIIVGVIYSFVLHGDLDITSFVAKRTLSRNSNLSYEKFTEDNKNKRKGSFNYPIFVGIVCIIISYIVSIFC